MTPDPIGLDGGINLYTYTSNNPVNAIDPLGLIAGVDDLAVAALATATVATVAYLNSPEGQKALKQIASDIHSIGKKMVSEINRIKQRVGGPQGIQYALRAIETGPHTDARGGVVYMKADDVWKYGETTNPEERYSAAWLERMGLYLEPQFVGTQVEIKIVEKSKIYGYLLVHGELPPGNKICR